MRSMWKGAVSFGLVMIPVKLYTATETKDIAFRQVHREDGGRIRFRRFCTIDDQEVPYEDIAKGYELPDGEMIVLTDEDMAELPLPTTKNIEVVQFTPADQLDPILLNRSYFVEPEGPGARAYCLLRDALEQSGKVAIAQVALRQRESLAILRSRDGVLVLETLLWPDEVRDPAFPFLDDNIEVRPQELRMASSLIESMTVDFDPGDYHDHYREALQELVAAKAEGREVIEPPAPVGEAEETSSLADALRASLEAARAGSARANGGRAAGADGGAKRAAAKSASSKSASSKPASSKSASSKSAAAKSDGAASDGAVSDGAESDDAKSDGGRSKSGTRKTAEAKSGTSKSGRASKKAAEDGAEEDQPAAQRRQRRAS
jgi:DNA end-binding protein Ku